MTSTRNRFLLATLLGATTLNAADYAWVEGEAPVTTPAVLAQKDFPKDLIQVGAAWGNFAIMSQGKLLHVCLDEDSVAKWVPAEGLTVGYDLEIKAGGKQEVWGRIGYEFVRAPLRWRIAGGAWTDIPADTPTMDVMPIQTFNELAWLKFGEVALPRGKVRIEVNWPKNKTRILGMLDALCVAAPGVFQPSGLWQPGQDHRSAAEQAAEKLVFKLPEASGAERTSVALTGTWQMANWDELVRDPPDRLGPVQQLPPMDAQRWFAYNVPGDRNQQRPDYVFHHRFVARCRVDVPASQSGKSFLLDFQRFNTIASVIVNGQYCGFSKDHSTAWQLDITKAVKPGAVNEIAVVFKDRYYAQKIDSTIPNGWRGCWAIPSDFLSGNQGVCARYELAVAADPTAGITEPVALIAAGPAYAADVFVKTSVRKKELALEVTLSNPGAARTVKLACAALPWSKDGAPVKPAKTMKTIEVQLAAGETKTVSLTETWADPQLWWPDDVHLYNLVATLSEGGKVTDISRTRFGFREWSWDSHVFKLNGIKWQLWADLEYNWNPKDLVANRGRTGCNLMRLWSNGGLDGMTRRDTLAFFDETGMVVRESGTMDGQVGNYGGGLTEEVTIDGKTVRRAKKILFDNWKGQLTAWMKAERNHPSIFIWSVENEVTFINSYNLGQSAQVEPAMSDVINNTVMKLDPTRPAMVDGGNCLLDESLPVNGAHYTEFFATDWRDFPDSCYTREHWYDKDHKERNWRFVPNRPIMQGEVFFSEGYSTENFATIGGERCFIGIGETRPARGVLGQIFSEGWRWGEVAAWHFWHQGGDYNYYSSWQPVAVLSRQWNTSFGTGQKVTRLLKVFNNTSKADPITAAWELQVGGVKVAGERKELALAAGTDQEWPVTFTIPVVKSPAAGSLILTAQRGGVEIFRTERTLRILVPSLLPKPVWSGDKLAVFDPKGSVLAYLKKRGIDCIATKSLDEIPATAKVLVIGPDAIPSGRASDPLWYSHAITGLKVLVLDQRFPLRYRALPSDLEPLDAQPTFWAQLQAKAAGVDPELRGRYGFPEDLSHPALAGLTQADFFTWGADHVMYRNPYRKGTRGYRSLLQCEAGLTCTALAECQAGEGLLLLSQLAIGEKLDTEAVAQQMFSQLLNYAASYAPVRRNIQAVLPADSQGAKLLKDIGVRHQVVADIGTALKSDGIAVIEANPANLAALAAKDEAVRTWCDKGNWLMLMGLTPEGLASFNKLVQCNHVLRPFDAERVLLAVPSDPLVAGLTLRDVVMDTGENMYAWIALRKPDRDEFSWIVDHTDIAPFCQFPTPIEMGKKSNTDPGFDHWPRNMVNGFTSDDNWKFCYSIILDQGHKTKWTLTLPKEEEIIALRIKASRLYHPITRINFYFDDDPTPVAAELRVDPVEQEIAIPPHKAKKVTMEVAKWIERGTANVVVIDNLWLKVKRPEEYLKRVKPLLNIGGLVRYNYGKGGIVLNQLKLLEREVNPVNADKKRNVCKTLLANLGAIFVGERAVVAGNQLKYIPVKIPDQQFNAYVRAGQQPGWWKGLGDMSGLPVGEQVFSGVRFNLLNFMTSPVPSVFMLRGPEAQVKVDKVEGIAVKVKADAMFFLHTFNAQLDQTGRWETRVKSLREQRKELPEPPTVLTYKIHYADGSEAAVPVHWSREIGNWVDTNPSGLPGASVAWAGKLAGAKNGEQAVVYVMQWNNPKPDVAITSVDLIAGAAQWGSAAVFAITTATVVK